MKPGVPRRLHQSTMSVTRIYVIFDLTVSKHPATGDMRLAKLLTPVICLKSETLALTRTWQSQVLAHGSVIDENARLRRRTVGSAAEVPNEEAP